MEMEIGAKLRSLRLEQKLSIEDVAEKTGFTKSFISQVERDKASPSIASLWKIAQTLGVTLSEIFEEKPKNCNIILKPQERHVFTSSQSKFSAELMVTDISSRKMAPLLVRLEVGADSDYYAHQGEEFGYLIQGQAVIEYGEETTPLTAGDSFYLDGSQAHRFVNTGDEEAIVLWVAVPPFF